MEKRTDKKVLYTLGHKELEINDTDVMIKQLTEIKLRYTYNEMYEKLKSKLRLSALGMRICTLYPGDRRKFSKTSIYLDGITAEVAIHGIDSLMLEQSRENNKVNLSACPDHYVLRPFGENELEVIETTGNSPFPVQFFIVLVTKPD